MSRYWECPRCRALLTRERLDATAGACPYCDARVGEASEFVDPDAPPEGGGASRFEPFLVPRSTGAKLAASLRLLLEQFPLIASLVLMIKLPANAAAELIVDRTAPNGDPFQSLLAKQVVDLLFGPISAAAIITVLAERMAGRESDFVASARAGFDAWWRVFAARVVAYIFILAGCIGFLIKEFGPLLRLLLLIPGVVLTVRYCLIDEVMVLERTSILQSRSRSSELVAGRAWRIVAAAAWGVSLVAMLAIVLGETLARAGLLHDPLAMALCDGLLNVFAAFLTILLFLFYWEAVHEPQPDRAFKPTLEEDPI